MGDGIAGKVLIGLVEVVMAAHHDREELEFLECIGILVCDLKSDDAGHIADPVEVIGVAEGGLESLMAAHGHTGNGAVLGTGCSAIGPFDLGNDVVDDKIHVFVVATISEGHALVGIGNGGVVSERHDDNEFAHFALGDEVIGDPGRAEAAGAVELGATESVEQIQHREGACRLPVIAGRGVDDHPGNGVRHMAVERVRSDSAVRDVGAEVMVAWLCGWHFER